MRISQTKKGKALIEATLYKKQRWLAFGSVEFSKVKLRCGTTHFFDELVVVDFENNSIVIDGHKQRMQKEISKDLVDIVRLKLTKELKHV
jgi:hypothetical protein